MQRTYEQWLQEVGKEVKRLSEVSMEDSTVFDPYDFQADFDEGMEPHESARDFLQDNEFPPELLDYDESEEEEPIAA